MAIYCIYAFSRLQIPLLVSERQDPKKRFRFCFWVTLFTEITPPNPALIKSPIMEYLCIYPVYPTQFHKFIYWEESTPKQSIRVHDYIHLDLIRWQLRAHQYVALAIQALVSDLGGLAGNIHVFSHFTLAWNPCWRASIWVQNVQQFVWLIWDPSLCSLFLSLWEEDNGKGNEAAGGGRALWGIGCEGGEGGSECF